MPQRDRGWRAVPRAVPALLVAAAGCRWVPARRPDGSVSAGSAGRIPRATVAAAPLPPLPLRPISDEEALALPGDSTPRLDPALAGAGRVERGIASRLDEPASPPPSRPAVTAGVPDLPRPVATDTGPGRWESAPATSLEPSVTPSESVKSASSSEETPAVAIEAADRPIEVILVDPGPPAVGDDGPTIADLRFCRKVLGFGRYEPADPDALKAGQSVLLYAELEGLRAEPEGDQFRSRLAASVEVLPGDDGPPLWSRSLGPAEDLCRRRRRDSFVNYRITLPDTLEPGPYRLRLTQTDELAGRSASRVLAFTIRPAGHAAGRRRRELR